MGLFTPTMLKNRIYEITADELQQCGVAALLLDVDNTLTTHDAPDLTAEVRAWLADMQAAGFSLIIVSNNRAERVAPFAEKIGLPYYAHARKPLPFGFRAAAKQAEIHRKKCVVIGDQLFTDMLGANLAGIPSILLEPIQPETQQKFIMFKRKIEKPMLNSRRQRRRRERDYGAR